MAFPGDAGVYRLLEGELKNSRPVYRSLHKPNNQSIYLYHSPGGQGAFWVISETLDRVLTGTKVEDSAQDPREITSTWQEYYNRVWRPNPSISIKCFDSGKQHNSRSITALHSRQKISCAHLCTRVILYTIFGNLKKVEIIIF